MDIFTQNGLSCFLEPRLAFDEESGLHFNLFRFYDPVCGRYTQGDPIGLMGGLNLYRYPLNPMQLTDPLGLNETSQLVGVNLRFNSAFRTPARQAALRNDPTAITPATTSLHSCGFAVDVNYSSLPNDEQRRIVREAAANAGLSWGGNFRNPDPPHFYVNPPINRATSIENAVRQYNELTNLP